MLASPPTSRSIYKFKKPGWPFVSNNLIYLNPVKNHRTTTVSTVFAGRIIDENIEKRFEEIYLLVEHFNDHSFLFNNNMEQMRGTIFHQYLEMDGKVSRFYFNLINFIKWLLSMLNTKSTFYYGTTVNTHVHSAVFVSCVLNILLFNPQW